MSLSYKRYYIDYFQSMDLIYLLKTSSSYSLGMLLLYYVLLVYFMLNFYSFFELIHELIPPMGLPVIVDFSTSSVDSLPLVLLLP